MGTEDASRSRGVEGRFRDFSADVREERLVRYIIHQVESGRHVKDIINDPYVVQHFDEVARSRILEHPDVIRGVEEHVRRRFADYGDSVKGSTTDGGDLDSPERVDDADLSDL